MHFPGIRLVKQTEQKFRRIRDCLSEKQKKKKRTSDCNSRAFSFYKRRLKKIIEEWSTARR